MTARLHRAAPSWSGAEDPAKRYDLAAAKAERASSPLQSDGEKGGLWPALLLLAVGLLGLCLATLWRHPTPGHYVVVSAPFSDRLTPALQIAAANGAMVAAGGFDNVMIAHSDRPEFSKDLRQAGAWLVFPAPRFLGCGDNGTIGAAS